MTSLHFKKRKYGRHHLIKQHFLSLIPIVATLFILTGCAVVGPDYVRKEPDSPDKWNTKLEGGLTTEDISPEKLGTWWTTFNDRKLSSLEKRAVKGNLDIRIAKTRILEARTRREISRAGLFPTLDASASATDHRSSENSGSGTENKLYSAGFDAGWELDLFGGVRRSVEAAEADIEVTKEDLHDTLVSLLAEVALNYVELRTYQARLVVTEANIRSQKENYELNRSRYDAGLIDELAVQQSLYNLEQTRSQLPVLQTGLEEAKNRLAVLLGEKPGVLHQELELKKPIPVPPVSVAVGIPAETLRHRPDIRRAERKLAAQTARIGVAKADLYPKLRLSGTLGLESISTNDFFEAASKTWSIGPALSWNIFDAGAIRRNIEVQTVLQKQALIGYESTVLKALEEVENVLTAYAKEQIRRESLKSATGAAKKAYQLSKDQYNAGLVDFGNVLDAQRSLQTFQDQLAQSEGVVTSNLIRLYKALGGGWKSLNPEP